MATYTNSHAKFDVAIDGVPFFLGQSPEFPYSRETAEFQRQQIDSTAEPGEQSLNGWWYRSQSSFHLGAGLKFYDPVRGNSVDVFRFRDSAGVDVFSQVGEVRLLRKCVLADATASYESMDTFEYGNVKGVLYEDGQDLRFYRTNGSTGTLHYYKSGTGAAQSNIWDIACSGSKYFTITSDGVYRGTLNDVGVAWGSQTGGTRVYAVPGTATRGRVEWCKERLFATVDNKVYQLVSSPGGDQDLPSDYAGTGAAAGCRLLYTHEEDDWYWSAIANGPDCVFFAGYAGSNTAVHGSRSSVWATTMETDNVSAEPQPTQLSQSAELPHGEYILSMVSYLDTFLILATTKGVRICAIGDGGALQVGPLTIEAANYCYDVTAWDRFVYATGASVDGYDGVWAIDLTAPVDDSGMRFAYAKHVASGYLSASAGYGKRVSMIGTSGRVALMVSGSGLWVEDESELVSSGWLQTGVIRFDTWTSKVFQYLRTVVDPVSVGTIRPYWLTESGVSSALTTATSVAGVANVDTAGSDGEPRQGLSYKWVLTRSTSTSGPTFQGFQVRALPAQVRQRSIRLPLLCFRKERMRGGRTVTRSVWDRISALESLEFNGKVVTFQDFNTGELRQVTVDNVQFMSDHPAQSQVEAGEPGGMLVVTLRSAD